MKASVMEEVKRIFKPEFLNRIDETIVFRALNKDDMKQIVGIMVRDLQKRCKEQIEIDLMVREAQRNLLSKKRMTANTVQDLCAVNCRMRWMNVWQTH